MIQFQTTIIYSSIGGGGNKNKLYIESAALQTNMMSSIGLHPSPIRHTDEERFVLLCTRVCVFVSIVCVRYLQQASAPREV